MVDKMFSLKFCVVLWCLCACGLSLPTKQNDKCGYQSCHPVKEGYINVHIVPHTHDDVGWLKTIDQYYYGSMQSIQNAGVQYILDSVVDALRKDPNRRFIYVETAFFWKWWTKQTDVVKHQVQRYVRSGQLEIIGGAWSMNDEATTHYQSIIDQFAWGLRKLNDTFGECGRPKIGWQIDPFGHSREMASIFSQLGYDGILLGRIDHEDKQQRFDTRTPEFIWQGSDNLGEKSKIFTSIMYNTYSPPPGFCFDILCSDEPIIDDSTRYDYNVPRRVKEFFEYLDNVTKAYATDNLIITMGEDFNYQAAHVWFTNLDKLILYSNKQQKDGSKYNLIYSTPSCYLKAVQESAARTGVQWTIKTDDFFPYASDPHAFWTGYFTSRPTLKRFERMGNNFLQVCKQLYSLTDLGPEDWADLNALREAMGVMQHHDAVTGTEKQHVAYDYARLLSNGFKECEFVAATALSKIVTGHAKSSERSDPAPEISFESCLLANVSQCEKSETMDNFIVTVYNPLSRAVSHFVRLPVTGTAYKVTDYKGDTVLTQMIPTAESIQNIPGRFSASTVELIFRATDIPPLGFLSFYVSKIPGNQVLKSKKKSSFSQNIGANDVQLEISIDSKTGKMSKISVGDINLEMSQDFYYYRGMIGDNRSPTRRSSGAYIFRPNGTEAFQIAPTATYEVYEGDLVSEIHQVFRNWTSQIIRLYKDEYFVEFDWLVGPIPATDMNGKEIITKYSTDLVTNSTFYTDSNGREMLRRVRNFRPTWEVKLDEPVSGNYYPVTSKILIKDDIRNLEVAVLTDRAEGGSSLRDGELEVMVHRNCLHDDAFGVGEALEEEAFGEGLVARGSHYLVVGPSTSTGGSTSTAARERDIAQRKLLASWTFISETQSLTYEEYKKKYKMKYSGLAESLPDNVQILTLEPWKANTFLLRLEHVLEKNEDPVLSKPVTVNLAQLFTPFDIIWYNETTLGANQWLQDNQHIRNENKNTLLEKYSMEERYIQYSNDDQINSNDIYTVFPRYHYTTDDSKNLEPFSVTLNPMQIRTFIIDVQKK